MPTIASQHLLFPLPRLLAERFGAEFFRAVPERPGVYLFAAASGGVLYVGKARNLRRRLASYRAALPERLPRRLRRVLPDVAGIHWDECPHEAAALARERELIRRLRPRGNTAGVYVPPPQTLAWAVSTTGLSFELAGTWSAPKDGLPPMRGVRPVHAALLRLTWWVAHPAAEVWILPPALTGERPPARWTLPVPAHAAAALAKDLAALADGEAEPVLFRWRAAASLADRFQQGWFAADAEQVRGFVGRLRRAEGEAAA